MSDQLQEIKYPIRLMHWIHLVSIFSLTFTGICIRQQYLKSYMYLFKAHHYFFMVIILINLLARFFYAFYGDTKNYKDFAIGGDDIKNTPDVLRYYLFMQNDYPHIAKYASLQKLTYNLFWMATIVQGYIGFAILKPELLLGLFGGSKVAIVWAKTLHTSVMWFFIIMTTVHVYISIIEGFPLLKLMLFSKEPKEI